MGFADFSQLMGMRVSLAFFYLHFFALLHSFSLLFFCVCLRRARQKRKTEALFFLRSEPGTDAEPSLQKIVESGSHFSFFLVSEPGTDARPNLTENVEREIGIADFRWLMGMRVSLAFFFLCLRRARQKRKTEALFSFFCGNRCWAQLTENVEGRPHFFFWEGVWTWNRCFAQLTENVERERERDCWLPLIDGNDCLAGFFFSPVLAQGKAKKKPSTFLSFFLRSEPGTSASLQKMWKVDRTFLFFLGCLNLEQVQAYRKCVEWTALFFWRSEPGTGASLQKMWRVDRTLLFFCGLNLEQMLSRAYRKCGRSTALFLFFFGVSEPGTGAGLQKMWRERDRDCWLPSIGGNEGLAGFFWRRARQKKTQALFFFFGVSEPGTGAEPSSQKMWKLFFLVCLNLEQVLACRKCGESTALFFFFRSETRAGAGRVDRNCGERIKGLLTSVNWWEWGSRWPFVICTFSHYYPLFHSFSLSLSFFFFPVLAQGKAKKKKRSTFFFFFCGLNLEQMLSPAYRKCGRSTALFFFFWVVSEPGTGASLQKIVESGSHFSFFWCLNLEQMLGPALQKMWRERDRDCWLPLIDGNERLAGFFFPCACAGQGKKTQALFLLFFCGLNLEQVQGRPCRKCGRSTALFYFFLGVWTWNRCQLTENVEGRPHFFFGVWTWNRCQLTENVESGPHFSLFFWRSEPGTDAEPSSKKMWKVDRTFFFGVSEPGTGAGLQKMWRERQGLLTSVNWWEWGSRWFFLAQGKAKQKPKHFFCGLNLEQMLSRAHRKCGWRVSGSHFSFFFGVSEPGTSAEPSLQKMWKVDRTFLFFRSEPRAGAGRVDRNCWEEGRVCWLQSIDGNEGLAGLFFICTCSHYYPLFHSFSLFFLFFLFSFFFALFHFFTFFTLFPFFHLFSFFSHSFSHFRWPGRGRSLAALPCLPLPHLTPPLLSSPSSTLFKKKEHRDFQQISGLRRSSCPPKRLITRSIHMSSCRRWTQIVIPNIMSVKCLCGQSTLLNRSSFFGTGVEVQRWCQKPSLTCACTRELLSDVGSFFVFLVE